MQTDASSETIELVTTDDIEQSNRGGPTSSSGDSRFRHPWHLIPYPMVAALLAHTGVGLQYNITFVVSVFIVRHFLGPGADEALVGKQAGLLAAAAPAGAIATSYAWGRFSDEYGRKNVIFVCTLLLGLSLTAMATAPNFPLTLLSRVVGGLFSGSVGSVKAVLGETGDDTQQALAIGAMSLVWGFGSITGPILVGTLSTPCTTHPDWRGCEEGSPPSFFRAYPYVLPCASCTLYCIVACGFVLAMHETAPRVIEKRRIAKRGAGYVELEMTPFKPEPRPGEAVRPFEVEDDGKRATGAVHQRPTAGLGHSSPSWTSLLIVKKEEEEEEKKLADDVHQERRQGNVATPHPPPTDWYYDAGVRGTLIGYFLIALLYCLLDELIPIFASTPVEHGGLGLSESDLAMPLACGGVMLILYTIFAMPAVAKRYTPQQSIKIGLICQIPVTLMLPTTSFFTTSRPTVAYLGLVVAFCLKSAIGVNNFTQSMLLINKFSPKSQLGRVNGAGQTLASLSRAVGPAVGGWLWSKTLGRLVFYQGICFSLSAIMCLAALSVYAAIPAQPSRIGL